MDCPPGDCGGMPGYDTVLDGLANPKHRDHAEVAAYPEDRVSREINERPLRSALRRIANHRNAARTRIDKTAT